MNLWRLILVTLALFRFLAPAAGHADGKWTSLGPEGGNVFALAVDPVTSGTAMATRTSGP